MPVKKKSRLRAVKAQALSSSPDAHSGNSARKKSKKSQESESVLRVRTPQDSPLQYLRDAGIIVPEEIPSDDQAVPLDFTQTSSREVGRLQSEYAVRHAHIVVAAAKVGSDVAAIKRDLRIAKAKFRLRHKSEQANIAAAMMEKDKGISELDAKLHECEAKERLLDAIALSYADVRDAASREITRRSSERASVD